MSRSTRVQRIPFAGGTMSSENTTHRSKSVIYNFKVRSGVKQTILIIDVSRTNDKKKKPQLAAVKCSRKRCTVRYIIIIRLFGFQTENRILATLIFAYSKSKIEKDRSD